MDPGNAGRSKKVVGLFLAAALTLTPGCSLNPFDWGRDEAPCTDANKDGYCDEDGRPVPRGGNRHYRTGFWGIGRSWGSSSGSGTGVKSGGSSTRGVSSGSKGGIGSSSRSGGGSSGG